jgi:flavin-dependent dehydrogenase
MDLKTLERYSSVSNRTLRSWIRAQEDPLPASARGGKILVSRRAFDEWMKEHAIEAGAVDIERTVNDILKSLR